MRSIKELLQIMLDNENLFECGLCSWTARLFFSGKITNDEHHFLYYYIRDNRPYKYSSINAYRNRHSVYYWTIGDKQPRINWTKKHIKLNN